MKSLEEVITKSPALLEMFLQMEERRERGRGDLSRFFPDGLRWAYFDAGKNGRRQRVHFCYSKTKNSAGKHLVWREVISKNGARKNDRWRAVSTTHVAAKLCRTWLRESEEARRPC